MTVEEQVDELVRDVTQVGSIPKSEARRRIREIFQAGIEVAIKELKPLVKRIRLDVNVIVCDCGEKYKDSDLDLSVGDLEDAIKKLRG